MVEENTTQALLDKFKTSMRAAAASISLLTARDAKGDYHGMAVTSWASLSMNPPSMMVAVNQAASVHRIISESRRFCLNLMCNAQDGILEEFSRSDLRHKRFKADHWRESQLGLPVLRDALSSQVCSVEAAHDYGTHTIFIGRVEEVFVDFPDLKSRQPLIWCNGSRAGLTFKDDA